MSSPRTLAHTFCRYLSMTAILFSNVGYFHHGFSPNICAHYGYIAPSFKGTLPFAYAVGCQRLKSSSPPNHGVSRNSGCTVCLDHPVPRPPSLTTSRRTYNIAKRNRRVGGFLISAYFAVIVVRCYRSSSDPSSLSTVRVGR